MSFLIFLWNNMYSYIFILYNIACVRFSDHHIIAPTQILDVPVRKIVRAHHQSFFFISQYRMRKEKKNQQISIEDEMKENLRVDFICNGNSTKRSSNSTSNISVCVYLFYIVKRMCHARTFLPPPPPSIAHSFNTINWCNRNNNTSREPTSTLKVVLEATWWYIVKETKVYGRRGLGGLVLSNTPLSHSVIIVQDDV